LNILAEIQSRWAKSQDFAGVMSSITRSRYTPAILADANLEPYTAEYLRQYDCTVVELAKTRQWAVRDEPLVSLARQHRLAIATHDHGFADPRRHDLSDMYGVVVLPTCNDNDGLNKYKFKTL